MPAVPPRVTENENRALHDYLQQLQDQVDEQQVLITQLTERIKTLEEQDANQ